MSGTKNTEICDHVGPSCACRVQELEAKLVELGRTILDHDADTMTILGRLEDLCLEPGVLWDLLAKGDWSKSPGWLRKAFEKAQ